MRVLLLTDDTPAPALLLEALAARGHEVRTDSRPEAAISRRAAGADEPWPVLVVYGADPAAAAALCRQVRALPVTGHCYLLATCPAPTPAALVSLVEAGADDVLPYPPEPATLDLRLAVTER